MKKEKSCGCIIIEEDKVLLIKQKNDSCWCFPKGHIEKNEREFETAKREVLEEVGIEVEIDLKTRYETTYKINNQIEKTSVYFVSKPLTHNIKIQTEEIIEAKWYNLSTALTIITYDNLKEILNKIIDNYK